MDLYVTGNPISREERAKINQNWHSISSAMQTLYDEMTLVGAMDFRDIAQRLEELEERATALCAEVEEAVETSTTAAAEVQTMLASLRSELDSITAEFEEIKTDINSRVEQTLATAAADFNALKTSINSEVDTALATAADEINSTKAAAATATNAANTAAAGANTSAASADTAAASADTAAAEANAAAALAIEAAEGADTAAANANAAATSANAAAGSANTAANAASAKIAEMTAKGEAVEAALLEIDAALAELTAVMGQAAQLQAKGAYSATVSYLKNNIVEHDGSSYVAIKDSKGVTPPTAADKTNEAWTLLAQRGTDGKGAVVSVNNIPPDAAGNVSLQIAATWDELQGVPETFTPSAHTHAISDVSGLETALQRKANTSTLQEFQTTVTSELEGKAPSAHTHAISEVTNLQSTLDDLSTQISGKASVTSPSFSGSPTAPTPTSTDNSTRIATTAYVQAVIETALSNLPTYESGDEEEY